MRVHKKAELFRTLARELTIISKSIIQKGGPTEEDPGIKAF